MTIVNPEQYLRNAATNINRVAYIRNAGDFYSVSGSTLKKLDPTDSIYEVLSRNPGEAVDFDPNKYISTYFPNGINQASTATPLTSAEKATSLEAQRKLSGQPATNQPTEFTYTLGNGQTFTVNAANRKLAQEHAVKHAQSMGTSFETIGEIGPVEDDNQVEEVTSRPSGRMQPSQYETTTLKTPDGKTRTVRVGSNAEQKYNEQIQMAEQNSVQRTQQTQPAPPAVAIDYNLQRGETPEAYNARIERERKLQTQVTPPEPPPQTQGGGDMLANYGLSLSPDAALSFQIAPAKSFQEVYQGVYDSIGLTGVKKQIDDTLKKVNRMDQEMANKIADINEDPWLTEGARVSQIRKIQERYELKRAPFASNLTLLQDLYDGGREEARYVATQTLNQYNAERQFAQDQLEFLIERAEKAAEAQAKLTEINPANFKEVQGGLFDVTTGEFVVRPTGDSDLDRRYKEAQIASLTRDRFQSVKDDQGNLYSFNPTSGEYGLSIEGETSTIDTSDPVGTSYARQYAATGSLANIPEEYRGFAMTEAYKYVTPGSIVDKTTGIPGTLSDAAKTKIQVKKRFADLARTMVENFYGDDGKPLTKGTNQIKEVFRESPKAAAFNLAQKQFEQLLRSDITGAAFSPEEILEYQSYLPKQVTGKRDLPGGVNQETRVNNLSKFVNDSLDSELNTYNAEIVGEFTPSMQKEYERLQKGATPEQLNEIGAPRVSIPKSSRLSYVNNNPGNLRYVGQTGAKRGEGGFARFSSPIAGFQALINQIRLDAKRGHTLASFISKYAPPSENDTKTYIKQITSALKTSEKSPIAMLDINKLARAIAQKESNTKIS